MRSLLAAQRLGDEELLVDRAIGQVLRAARAAAGTDDVPVNRLRAGEVSTNELAELLRIAVPEFTPMSNEQNEASANIVVFPGRDARRTR